MLPQMVGDQKKDGYRRWGRQQGQAYVLANALRHHKAKRADKGKILNELCAECGYHRNDALRCLNQGTQHSAAGPAGLLATPAPEVSEPLRAL